MFDDYKDWIYPVGLSLLLIIAYVVIYLFISWKTCDEKYYSYLRKWSVFGGCQIKIEGKYIPADQYRVF